MPKLKAPITHPTECPANVPPLLGTTHYALNFCKQEQIQKADCQLSMSTIFLVTNLGPRVTKLWKVKQTALLALSSRTYLEIAWRLSHVWSGKQFGVRIHTYLVAEELTMMQCTEANSRAEECNR